MTRQSGRRIALHGFNNLTKSLSFNIYDVSYAVSRAAQASYIKYIDRVYSAERLTEILHGVAEIIGATVLNVARQDYDPQGASVTMLIAEGMPGAWTVDNREAPGPVGETLVAHLDKSHLTVHTYPEQHPDNGISTFRVDIDVATCGRISPLKALNFLIHSFDSDIVVVDYRVRGFTRDVDGNKHFIDHDIHSIQNFIDPDLLAQYEATDFNVEQENIYQSKLRVADFAIEHYLYGVESAALTEQQRQSVAEKLEREILEIYYGMSMR